MRHRNPRISQRVFWTLAALAASLITFQPVQATPAPADLAQAAPDRLLVRFRDPFAESDLSDFLAKHRARVEDHISQLGVYRLVLKEGLDGRVLADFRQDSRVVYAEPDYIASGDFTPNDPYYASNQYGPQKIQANLAWDITHGSSSVVVAVLDTGIASNHPDLAGKVIAGYDFVNHDDDPSDDYGHGTHVAGIIGATTHNGTGVAGVGFDTRLLSVKVLNQNNSGYYSDIANGITYATDWGAKIINLSLGGTAPSQTLHDAVIYARNHRALIVAAAGNNASSTPFYPAAYPESLGVGATTSTDERWSLSNYGDNVKVVAPGSSVYSTYWNASSLTYSYKSGTSMATPHVSGVTALMLAVNSNLTDGDLISIIEQTADDLGDPGFDSYFGYGRVNAYRAVSAARPALPRTTAVIDPISGGTLATPDGKLVVSFPPNAVTCSTVVTQTDTAAPAQNLNGLSFADHSFTLEANAEGQSISQFNRAYTLKLTYQDSDWQSAGITSEDALNLFYYSPSQARWVSVLPCSGCTRDPVGNVITVQLDHFTEFALLANNAPTAVRLSKFTAPVGAALPSHPLADQGWLVSLLAAATAALLARSVSLVRATLRGRAAEATAATTPLAAAPASRSRRRRRRP
jgi:thermitase